MYNFIRDIYKPTYYEVQNLCLTLEIFKKSKPTLPIAFVRISNTCAAGVRSFEVGGCGLMWSQKWLSISKRLTARRVLQRISINC